MRKTITLNFEGLLLWRRKFPFLIDIPEIPIIQLPSNEDSLQFPNLKMSLLFNFYTNCNIVGTALKHKYNPFH